MGLRIETVTIDAVDPVTLAAFWCAALDWEQRVDEDGDIWIEPGDDHPEFDRVKPLLVVRANELKAGKNRLHLDLIPDDQEREVERLESLGASRPDIGQTGNESWVVLADPEGNEFCVLDEPDLSED
ncbi:MAG TPA: VOC family protein [Acidimicrobiales bacterium]